MESVFQTYDWERAVGAQLYQEYRSILWNHRLSLRPVSIQLFDSDTHWGKWDPTTRTIWIARKLIREYSWFHVQSILRHEMAHQMVDEFYDPSQKGRPHGDFFRLACQHLGVPEEFTQASIQLQESSLDWRTEKVDEASEKLLDKVRKLLALATSSNEHEAFLAMNKVRELYAKYNLEQAEGKKSHFAHIVITHGKKRIEPHQARVISILVEHFFVEILTSNLFDAKTGETHRALEIIGTRENVLMAEYVYYFLLQQMDFWMREMIQMSHRKTSPRISPKISPMARKSFRLGILAGFSEKLKQSEKGPSSQASSDSSHPSSALTVVGQAMVKFRQDQQLKNYLSSVYPRISHTTSSAQTVDHLAYGAGK